MIGVNCAGSEPRQLLYESVLYDHVKLPAFRRTSVHVLCRSFWNEIITFVVCMFVCLFVFHQFGFNLWFQINERS